MPSTINEKMQAVHCPICGPEQGFKVRYEESYEKSKLEFVGRKTPDHMHFRIVQCTGCGLIYSNPIIPENEIISLYRKSKFIEEPQLNNMVEDYLYQLNKAEQLFHKGRLLEVGCSSGFFLERAKQLGFDEVFGIEPSEEAAAQAPEEIQKNIAVDILKPGLFEAESMDVACFFQVFDHIVQPNEFLTTLHQYLKPGGLLLAIHHNIKSLMPTILGSKASTYDISHIHLWDKKTMRLILEKNGYKVHYIKNIPNKYQLDHVIRMLPLPEIARSSLRKTFQFLRMSNWNLKVAVENMVTVAAKNG